VRTFPARFTFCPDGSSLGGDAGVSEGCECIGDPVDAFPRAVALGPKQRVK
jgi:hypothetical protein